MRIKSNKKKKYNDIHDTKNSEPYLNQILVNFLHIVLHGEINNSETKCKLQFGITICISSSQDDLNLKLLTTLLICI